MASVQEKDRLLDSYQAFYLNSNSLFMDDRKNNRKYVFYLCVIAFFTLSLIAFSNNNKHSSNANKFSGIPGEDYLKANSYEMFNYSNNSLISWTEESQIPFSYGRSRIRSAKKDELSDQNLQNRTYWHLGTSNEYQRVNVHNSRIKKRRERMLAFDKVRVSYCGDISQTENNWKDFKYRPISSARYIEHMYSTYNKNTIDYAIQYNDRGLSSKNEVRNRISEDSRHALKISEAKRRNLLQKHSSQKYSIGRFLCEREWEGDAPEGYEGENITVSIERLGPFYSYGDYDWNSVMMYNNALNLSSKFQENDFIYVVGTFFMPVFPNGTIISYPPLHVHHTHLHPYENSEMNEKIQVFHNKIRSLIVDLDSGKDYDDIIDSLFNDDEIQINDKRIHKLFDRLKTNHIIDKVKHLMNLTLPSSVNHHVVLQGHGDGECINEQGGADCVLHLLEPNHGYRVFRSTGFSGNFEINDVRNRGKNYKTYFDDVFSLKTMQEADKEVKDFLGKVDVPEVTNESLQEQDNHAKPKRKLQLKDIRSKRLKHTYETYVDATDKGKLEYYIDVGVIWTKKKQIETTFLQFGNPPTGLAWMTYAFPLDENTNLMYYNYTHAFLGPGELSNFILHSHMVYTDSLYVFKGNQVYEKLDYLTKGKIPYIFECRENQTLSEERKDELLQMILDTGATLVCEGTKPTLVLYCDKENTENCIYRDRRIDFNCLEKVRLEEGETLNIIAFNRVRNFSSNGKASRPDPVNDVVPDLNSVAIASSFGYSWTAHQHSFFRGDFVSDKAKMEGFSKSFGKASLDILAGQYAPPAYFWYGYLRNQIWESAQREYMVEECPASISFDSYLPWENLFDDLLLPYIEAK